MFLNILVYSELTEFSQVRISFKTSHLILLAPIYFVKYIKQYATNVGYLKKSS